MEIILYWQDIELSYAGKTETTKYLTKEALQVSDLELWSGVPLE